MSVETNPQRRKILKILSSLSIGAAVLGIAIAVFLAYPVFFTPRGAPIRPMGQVFLMTIVAAGTAALGIPIAIASFVGNLLSKPHQGLGILLALIGFFLNLLPLPVFFSVVQLGVHMRDLHWSP